MKTILVAAVSAAGLSAMVTVVAEAGELIRGDDELKAEAAVDANGTLQVPDAYRTT
jgi:hypothetical protein